MYRYELSRLAVCGAYHGRARFPPHGAHVPLGPRYHVLRLVAAYGRRRLQASFVLGAPPLPPRSPSRRGP